MTGTPPERQGSPDHYPDGGWPQPPGGPPQGLQAGQEPEDPWRPLPLTGHGAGRSRRPEQPATQSSYRSPARTARKISAIAFFALGTLIVVLGIIAMITEFASGESVGYAVGNGIAGGIFGLGPILLGWLLMPKTPR